MQSKDQITVLNITNQSNQNINVQIIPHKWEQISGEDVLTPTSDILVIPPLLSLNPGSVHSIRIARRNMIDSSIEQNYRLIVKEFDAAMKGNNAPGLRLILNISLPLFIMPTKTNQSYTWKIENKDSQTKRITLINNSNVHAMLTDIKLVNKNNEIVSEPLRALSYILPFQSKEWDIRTIDHIESNQLKVLSNISFPQNI